MRRSLFSIATGAVLLAGVQLAAAQGTTTTTTTTWTNDQGAIIRDYSVQQHYNSIDDPNLKPSVGVALPGTVSVYPLPQAVAVPDPDLYSYTIINNRPVIVERTTRRVVHTWE